MEQQENKNIIMKIFAGSTALRMVCALLAVGLVSGAFLVLVYNYATPKIEVNKKSETKKAIMDIFPDAKDIKDMHNEEIFSVKDASGKILGYAFTAEGNGYQGTIKMLAGANADLTSMKGIEVLESQETPGLGAEIAEDKFRGQFNGLSITHDIEYVKNKKPEKPYEIEAITGATISSRSVVSILNEEIERVRKFLKEQR